MSGHLTGFYKNPRNILHFFNLLSFQETLQKSNVSWAEPNRNSIFYSFCYCFSNIGVSLYFLSVYLKIDKIQIKL